MLLETTDLWAVIAGTVLVLTALLGVLFSVDFPGAKRFKTTPSYKIWRIVYAIFLGLVAIAFVSCFAAIILGMDYQKA